jgi:DNA-binding MltR family transcriptional regulator
MTTSVENILAQLRETERTTHHGVVITAAAQIDSLLEKLLLAHMRTLNSKEWKKLFRGYGPISTFSAKIDLAYAFNLIPKSMSDAAHALRDLRNAMAHSEELVDLSHPKIKPFFDKLTIFEPVDAEISDEDRFSYVVYSIGVSLGGYISELQRRPKRSLPPYILTITPRGTAT